MAGSCWNLLPMASCSSHTRLESLHHSADEVTGGWRLETGDWGSRVSITIHNTVSHRCGMSPESPVSPVYHRITPPHSSRITLEVLARAGGCLLTAGVRSVYRQVQMRAARPRCWPPRTEGRRHQVFVPRQPPAPPAAPHTALWHP